MKKYFLILFIFLSLISTNVYALEDIKLYSPNYVIYDLTDDELRGSANLDKKISIASLTKIMTTITAIELANDLNKEITITPEVFNGIPWDATVAKLKVGDKVTLNDLLYASILPSGADATQALAINLSGSVPNFVKEMNALAERIGMSNSHFVNVTGLDIDNHYSTLEDLVKLLKYSLQNDTFKTVYQTKEYTLTNGLEVHATTYYYNKKLDLDISRIKGSKTGFTSKAGISISVLFESNGHDYISITTGAPKVENTAYNMLDALTIIDYIDNNYNNNLISEKNKTISKVKVNLSKTDYIDIKTAKDIYLYLPNDYDKNLINITYDGLNEINYNQKVGSKLGTINITYDDKLISTYDVLLDNKLEFSITKYIKKNIVKISVISIIVIFIIYVFIRRKINQYKRKKRRAS